MLAPVTLGSMLLHKKAFFDDIISVDHDLLGNHWHDKRVAFRGRRQGSQQPSTCLCAQTGIQRKPAMELSFSSRHLHVGTQNQCPVCNKLEPKILATEIRRRRCCQQPLVRRCGPCAHPSYMHTRESADPTQKALRLFHRWKSVGLHKRVTWASTDVHRLPNSLSAQQA